MSREKDRFDIFIDNNTVQSCCICYGGNSFPGPMKEALECYLSILSAKYPTLAAALKQERLRLARIGEGGDDNGRSIRF